MKQPGLVAATLFLLLLGGTQPSWAAESLDAVSAARRIRRSINLGNMLEAPHEGAWGLRVESYFFDRIREAGFDGVRVPIRWSAHAERSAPYSIDPEFLERVDWVVGQALERDLAIILDLHHYEEMFSEPQQHRERFLALWRQLAEHYREYPDTVLFELLNEPHGELDAALWNEVLRDALAVIRESNPQRVVIVGPGHWNNISQLPTLELPEEDRQLIVTFHYYLPMRFTHQGASWVGGSDAWLGTQWRGSDEEKAAVRDHFQGAVQWASEQQRPLFLGEFGAYQAADLESRVRWTRFVRQEAERHGIAWAYWELASGFGVLDPQARAWRSELLDALLPSEP